MNTQTHQPQTHISKPSVLLFAFQISIIFIVICVSLLNLTLQWGNLNLWTVILTSSLGYIMPNPKLKVDKTGEEKSLSNQSM